MYYNNFRIIWQIYHLFFPRAAREPAHNNGSGRWSLKMLEIHDMQL